MQLQASGGYSLDVVGPERLASQEALKQRLSCLQPFLDLAAHEFTRLGHPEARFRVQLHDEAPHENCFRFDGPLDPATRLGGAFIPDPYALGSQGFLALRQQFSESPLPRWQERLNMAIWRGSSTGTEGLTLQNLAANHRYQLCQASQCLGEWLDARLTSVVQAHDPTSAAAVLQHLTEVDLLAPRLSPWHLGLHRWLVEIDGNVNSWGLLWKLLSGSCILRVLSDRRQWYHHQLQPWRHFVPIAADLHNLEEVLSWCRSHLKECAAIAHSGQSLAHNVVYKMAEEQRDAIRRYATNWLQ